MIKLLISTCVKFVLFTVKGLDTKDFKILQVVSQNIRSSIMYPVSSALYFLRYLAKGTELTNRSCVKTNKKMIDFRKMFVEVSFGATHGCIVTYHFRGCNFQLYTNTESNITDFSEKKIFLSVPGPIQIYFLSVLRIICLSYILKVNKNQNT